MLAATDQNKKVRVGVLGDRAVGKTYLSHKLAGLSYEGYSQTTKISEMKSQESQQTIKFVYVDNPALDKQSIVSIGSVHHYDVLVFLFKDCVSFTKLYQFFEAINQAIKKGINYHVQYYWQHIKKVIVVYSNFQSDLQVQLPQLFDILTEEIGYFCSTVNFVSFSLQKKTQNWKDLKFLIQKQPVFMELNQEISDISSGAQSSTLHKNQNEKEEACKMQLEEARLSLEQQLTEERVNFLVQQKTEVIVLSNDLQEIRQIEIPITPLEISKDVETTSAEVVRQSQKSKDENNELVQKKVEKHPQIIEITQKDAVETQKSTEVVERKIEEQPKRQQTKVQHRFEEVQVVSFEVEQADYLRKTEIRKESIIKKIQQSFFKSIAQQEEPRKSILHNQDVPKQYVQVQKNENTDLLPNFRASLRQYDPKIDVQLDTYNVQKLEKLKNNEQASEDEPKLLVYKANDHQKRASLEYHNQSPEKAAGKSTEMKGILEEQVFGRRRPERQQQAQGQAKCSCQIM